jgi:hypothetical protein
MGTLVGDLLESSENIEKFNIHYLTFPKTNFFGHVGCMIDCIIIVVTKFLFLKDPSRLKANHC